MNKKKATEKTIFSRFGSAYPEFRFSFRDLPGVRDQETLIATIATELGLSSQADEASARRLVEEMNNNPSLSPVKATLSRLENLLFARNSLICGSGGSLDSKLEELSGLLEAGPSPENFCLVAADGAISGLRKAGLWPDIVVTDLDGPMEIILEANRNGAALVVLAHGDNAKKVARFVPHMGGHVLGTTQRGASPPLFNFGGFTDGDRAALLAHAFGAKSIVLLGFDFPNPGPYSRHYDLEMKKRKLVWCQRILENVETLEFREWLKER